MPTPSLDLEPILAGMKALQQALAERIPTLPDPALRAELEQLAGKLAGYQTQVPEEMSRILSDNRARIDNTLSEVNAMMARVKKHREALANPPQAPSPPVMEAPAPAFAPNYGQQLRAELVSRYPGPPCTPMPEDEGSVEDIKLGEWEEYQE